MINANEARTMLKANIQKDEEALRIKIQKFLDENCEPAILAAIEKRQDNAFVEIPAELQGHTTLITTELTANRYKAQIRHGIVSSVLIMWK